MMQSRDVDIERKFGRELEGMCEEEAKPLSGPSIINWRASKQRPCVTRCTGQDRICTCWSRQLGPTLVDFYTRIDRPTTPGRGYLHLRRPQFLRKYFHFNWGVRGNAPNFTRRQRNKALGWILRLKGKYVDFFLWKKGVIFEPLRMHLICCKN